MSINQGDYTDKQGQYLAFIFYYTKLNGIAPAQKNIQKYFGVTPPTVHQMIMELEKKNLISRVPGKERAIKICISEDKIPKLR